MAQNADQALAQLADRVERAILRKLTPAAEDFEGVLLATGAYDDDTGANRGATYAAAATARNSSAAQRRGRQALGEAERLNPGQGEAEEIAIPDDVVRVVGTSMTAYVQYLEGDAAGRHAYLADSLRLEAPRLQDAALDGIREVMR